ncbi:MAG: ATP-binding protein [Bacteroidetes bacterium]|nr:ATP-binding protein [Bacteroidota bacterium]
MKKELSEILTQHRERFVVPAQSRFLKVNPDLPKVQTITGARRTGKSSLLKLTIAGLLEQGIGWNKVCFLSLENERLRGESFDPDEILQAFAALNPENPLLKEVYFFFDEIQYLGHWENFINRIHEQISRNVIITGSNSKLLHTEVAGVLRGRGLPTELLPLSFVEYLKWKNITFGEFGSNKVQVISAFDKYLFQGGYPETVLAGNEQINEKLLQEYFNAVLFRDIIDQNHPANYRYLRYLFHRIADNTGKPTGLHKIFRELKTRGYAISQNKLYEMADLAESVYLYKRISRFDASLIKRENTDKKCYFIDNGMLRALGSAFSENRGMLLENMAFWQLYRQYGNIYTTDIYYYSDASSECDFVLWKSEKEVLPVQVTWEMKTEETRQREVKGLLKACKATGARRGIIITYDTEEQMKIDGIRITILPAWKWCGTEADLYAI